MNRPGYQGKDQDTYQSCSRVRRFNNTDKDTIFICPVGPEPMLFLLRAGKKIKKKMFRGIFRISYLPEISRLIPVLAVSGNGVISEVCNVWKKTQKPVPGESPEKM